MPIYRNEQEIVQENARLVYFRSFFALSSASLLDSTFRKSSCFSFTIFSINSVFNSFSRLFINNISLYIFFVVVATR